MTTHHLDKVEHNPTIPDDVGKKLSSIPKIEEEKDTDVSFEIPVKTNRKRILDTKQPYL